MQEQNPSHVHERDFDWLLVLSRNLPCYEPLLKVVERQECIKKPGKTALVL